MDADDKTKKNAISKTTWDLLYLMACALHDKTPDAGRLARMDLEKVHQLAGYHSLTSMACMALEGSAAFEARPDLAKRWRAEKDQAIRKNMLLNAERVQIIKELEQAGIWYLPLKGEEIQDLYPVFGMRQSADVDILYDSSRRQDLVALMERRGYRDDSVGKGHHDTFKRPPVYNIEMHTSLAEKRDGKLYVYYRDVKERLAPAEGAGCGFRFREEDFYIYMVAHEFNHYRNGGTGLRTLSDNYVYLRKKGKELDWIYIQKVLMQLDMATFEGTVRSLSEKLFDGASSRGFFSAGETARIGALTDKELALLADCASSGTYGTVENNLRKQMERLGVSPDHPTAGDKLRYIWKRLFPDREWIRQRAPFVAGHVVLIPFYLVYRMVRQLVRYRKGMKKELKELIGLGKE